MASRGIKGIKKFVQSSFQELFDMENSFSRLLQLGVVSSMADTFVTISMAGTLFFSASLHEARSKIILYLILTVAPFAVVTPFLGPLIDRGRRAKRLLLFLSIVFRALLCILIARSIHSILLFPEVFSLMVFSRLFMIVRSAMMPESVSVSEDLASLNAKFSFLTAVSNFVAGGLAASIYKLFGSAPTLEVDVFIYFFAALLVFQLKRPEVSVAEKIIPEKAHVGRKVLLKEEIIIALSAISVLRGSVGFATFLIAFDFRRSNEPDIFYGLAIASATAGSLIGALLVKTLRNKLSANDILTLGFLISVILPALSAVINSASAQAILTFSLGFSLAIAKPSYDSIIQAQTGEDSRGRAIARSETQLQLVWVIGGLLASLFAIPLAAGDIMLAVAGAISLFSFLSANNILKSARRRDRALNG